MAYIGKEFKIEKEEKIEEFIAAIDAGSKAKSIFSLKPNQKITKDGDGYILVLTAADFKKEYKFKPGVAFDVVIAEDIVAKSTVSVDGDTFNQVLDFGDKGTITLKREFQADSLKITLSTNKWDGTATRYYVPA